MLDPNDFFTDIDESALAPDLMLTDPLNPEGSDLAVEGFDLAAATGLDAYHLGVLRRLQTPRGSIEIYVEDVAGVAALDGTYGVDYFKTVAEPVSFGLFDRIASDLKRALAEDPTVATYQVTKQILDNGQAVFTVLHAPAGGVTYTDRFQFTSSGLVRL